MYGEGFCDADAVDVYVDGEEASLGLDRGLAVAGHGFCLDWCRSGGVVERGDGGHGRCDAVALNGVLGRVDERAVA
jgi:hypothetical protein